MQTAQSQKAKAQAHISFDPNNTHISASAADEMSDFIHSRSSVDSSLPHYSDKNSRRATIETNAMFDTHLVPTADTQITEEKRDQPGERLIDINQIGGVSGRDDATTIGKLFQQADFLLNGREPTMLQKVSNEQDVDYLLVRKPDNIRFFDKVQKLLETYEKDFDPEMKVFSEVIYNYEPSFKYTEMIILLTKSAIYLLDQKCEVHSR